jgi:hypothetical protein
MSPYNCKQCGGYLDYICDDFYMCLRCLNDPDTEGTTTVDEEKYNE